MESLVRQAVFGVAAVGCVVLLVTGCAGHPQYVAQMPPAPPPAWASASLVQAANGNGFRDGHADGERDVLSGNRYNARADGKFRVTPGYDERFGPYDLYRDMYRQAYAQGYDNGFRHARRDR